MMPESRLPAEPVAPRGRTGIRAFTLVEFLVGVLFLAAVLALAVPRLWNMGSEARVAKQQAIFGSVRAAAQITRAAARVHNQMGPSGSVEVDGTRISTVFGYPTASAAGIVAATGLDTVNDQISLSDGGAHPGSSIVIALDGAHGTCSIAYTAPDTPEAQPRIDLLNASQSAGSGC
jgi:MSHA pilin protein MshA